MKSQLIDYLICPVCGTKINIIESKGGKEIHTGTLECMNEHRYPIIRGVPRMIISSKHVNQVKESFSEKWKKFENTTFSSKELEFQYEWYISRYGFKSPEEFSHFLRSKFKILDAGCGVGRAVEWFSNDSNGIVFGVDFSESIDIAYLRYGHRKNVHLIQADLSALPFREGFFDYISCDQVIHHTPVPEQVFRKLVDLLEGQGEIAVYVYKKKGPIREFSDDYIRERTTKMNAQNCMEVATSITKLGKALSELKSEVTIPEDIPILDIKAGTYDIQRFIYWNILKCFWAENNDFERSLAVNFDWYHPKYAFRFSPEEFKKWFEENALQIKHFSIVESGISSVGIKRVFNN
jgi:ubiquinone/menaquinone biosynthesis C-methylase UbiE